MQEQISTRANPSVFVPFAIDPLLAGAYIHLLYFLAGWIGVGHWREPLALACEQRSLRSPELRATLSTGWPNTHPWRVAIDFACFRPTHVTSSLRPEGLERGGRALYRTHHRQDHLLPLAHAFETPGPCPPNSADCHLHSALLCAARRGERRTRPSPLPPAAPRLCFALSSLQPSASTPRFRSSPATSKAGGPASTCCLVEPGSSRQPYPSLALDPTQLASAPGSSPTAFAGLRTTRFTPAPYLARPAAAEPVLATYCCASRVPHQLTVSPSVAHSFTHPPAPPLPLGTSLLYLPIGRPGPCLCFPIGPLSALKPLSCFNSWNYPPV